MDLANILRDFKGISEVDELQRRIDLHAKDKKYRFEVLESHTNNNARYSVSVFEEKNGSWKRIEDFPWSMERTEESALRSALSFLEDRVG
jgi:hypothetical protein